MTNRILLAVAVTALAATPAAAQGNKFNNDKVPAGHRPPPGMCRIWLDGVPPGQQPAPTDCATAVRNRPANGRVIFGDDYDAKGNKKATGHESADQGAGRDESRGNPYRDAGDNRPGRDERGVQTVPATQTMPEMMGAVFVGQGRRVADVRRWLGSTEYTPRFTAREGRAPDRVTWLDAGGQTVQVWIDSNDDGQADIVELYQRGKLVTRYRQ
jgi:hypothetical protein